MKSATLLLIILFHWIEIFCQNYSVSGYIEDAKSGERLISAMIYDSISHSGSNSNSYGYFNIKCRKGSINLICSYIGYKTTRVSFSLHGDTTLNILLQPRPYTLGEVIIGEKRRLVESSRMSVTELPMVTIKQIPMLLGETDVLKALQSLPGVQTGTEGTSGLYIRGGGPDQNLILLDGVPVYNPDHLFGFVSIFNSDAIKNVTLITGGFPAQYGGRLSSVVDIRMKEGNTKEFHGEGSIGLISPKFMLEGPLVKDKTSILISGRRSWLDLVTQKLPKGKNLLPYYFYDLTAKVNHIFSSQSRLYLSVYTGNDHISSLKTKSEFVSDGYKYNISEDQNYGWGNMTAALRWNYIFNHRLFSNTSLTYSNYKYFDNRLFNSTKTNQKTGAATIEDYKSVFNTGIKDIASKIDFDYHPFTVHNIKFGIGNIYHTFTPNAHISMINTSNDSTLTGVYTGNDSTFIGTDRNKTEAFEPSFYLEDEMELGSRLKVNVGFRLSSFLVKNKAYGSVEPRLSGRYLLTDRWALKFAYSRMKQYMHLLTSSRITFPTDLWVPATDSVSPQMSDQYALGSIYSFNDNFELSIETYYKSMKNLIEYSEGSSFLESGSWESKIEKGGIGRAYGLEFMLKKNSGKLTGWIAYTLSKTERRFDNIGDGKWFPYKYDRRHDLNIIINYKMNSRIDAGLNWEFSSGNCYTLFTDAYDSFFYYGGGNDIQNFENRNNFRLPPYHRLDIGINFHRQKKSSYRTWSVSIYNVYNHKNTFFVYLGTEKVNGNDVLVYKKYTLFPILPSVTYSLKF